MFEEKYKTIGLNIMYYRRALSLTQSELAEKAKMSRARVSYGVYIFAGAGFGG